VANLLTCPGEIIRTVDIVSHRDGVVAGSTVGLLQGVWRTLLRAGAGVAEVLTFFVEVPKGYRPLIEPEYVFAHGAWQE
jgi:putative exosortase-associated protein (TIGR04073 family)